MSCDAATNGPVVFPDVREVIAADAARFRALAPMERWQELFAIRRWGELRARDPARRATIERLWADDEARWRRIQAELIARHGK